MGVRGGEDPGKTNDLRPQQGEARHPVAGLPEVLDQCERGPGERRKHRLVQRQVALRRIEVAAGEQRVGRAQERHELDGTGLLPDLGPRAGDQIDLLHGALAHPPFAALAPRAPPLTHAPPPGRGACHLQLERHEGVAEGRDPEADTGQEHALRVDDPRCLGEAALVLLVRRYQGVVDRPTVDDLNLLGSLLSPQQTVALERGCVDDRRGRGVDPPERCCHRTIDRRKAPARRHRARLQPGMEHELHAVPRRWGQDVAYLDAVCFRSQDDRKPMMRRRRRDGDRRQRDGENSGEVQHDRSAAIVRGLLLQPRGAPRHCPLRPYLQLRGGWHPSCW